MSMTDRYILDENKRAVPCEDLHRWAMWFEKHDNRRVAETEKNGVRVSTVFLGIDHAFGGPRPLLFETMIFGGPKDGYQDRCSTWSEAEHMHKFACAEAGIHGEG